MCLQLWNLSLFRSPVLAVSESAALKNLSRTEIQARLCPSVICLASSGMHEKRHRKLAVRQFVLHIRRQR